MTVAVEGGLDRGVAQLRLKVLRMGVVGDQQAGVGVAEVVKPDVPEPSAPGGFGKPPVPEVVGIDGRAVWMVRSAA